MSFWGSSLWTKLSTMGAGGAAITAIITACKAIKALFGKSEQKPGVTTGPDIAEVNTASGKSAAIERTTTHDIDRELTDAQDSTVADRAAIAAAGVHDDESNEDANLLADAVGRTHDRLRR